MSAEPTDIVFTALRQMQANGMRLRASLGTCGQLSATSSAASTTLRAAAREEVRENPAPRSAQPETHRESPPKPRIATPDFSEQPRTQATPALSPNGSEKAAKLAALRGPVLACTKCPHLVQSRTQVVFGVGNPDAELMFVGEAPGADEDMVGEPFVGRAGQMLTRMITAMNLRRADVYIANILKCRPNMQPGEPGDRKPEPAEMNVCKPYLLRQIEIIQPKVIVALGGAAVEGLLGIEHAGITKMRGTWKEFHGIPMMPTYHPAYLLHNQSHTEKRKVWEDLMAVLERLGHELTEKQRGFFLTK